LSSIETEAFDMRPIRSALAFGLALVLGLALTTLTALAASPTQPGISAVQSAIRDIRDRLWLRTDQQQLRPAAKRPATKPPVR
jgi:hypothetical protein